MLEKPNIADETIILNLNLSFGLSVNQLEFLPIGNDSGAWAYRVDVGLQHYFLKLRKGKPNPAMLYVPDYLKSCGIPEVVAPLQTLNNKLYAQVESYSLILYPFIEGQSMWGMPLSNDQWQDWGNIMHQIHAVDVTIALSEIVPTEAFVSKWDRTFKKIRRLILSGEYEGDIATQFAEHWKSKKQEIELVYLRHMALGARIKQQNLQLVLCHADIHKANIMLDAQEQIHIVDWDEVVIAPKERDLMFFMGNGYPANDLKLFLEGYVDRDISHTALAYYRYEWVVQEFGDWGERVFLNDALSDVEKQHALDGFKQLFDAGDVVELAHQAFDKA